MNDNIYFEKVQLSDLEAYHARNPIHIPAPKNKLKINKRDVMLFSGFIACCVVVGLLAWSLNVAECLR